MQPRNSYAPVAAIAAIMALTACGQSTTPQHSDKAQAPEAAPVQEAPVAVAQKSSMDAVLSGAHRTDKEKARDVYRNPKDTLAFFEINKDMTVAELFPGGGWYTKVIAPYLASGSGTFIAVNSDPGDNEGRQERLKQFEDKFSDETIYGSVKSGLISKESGFAQSGTVDVVLTFRNIHNLMKAEVLDTYLNHSFDALKPGGILGVVEHRAGTDTPQDPQAQNGYVREDFMIAAAQKAGFEFVSSSEINANPKDTRDHPFGVWTLPPVKRSSVTYGEKDPSFDSAPYVAIGESDRMTLKFRKPVGAEGSLLE